MKRDTLSGVLLIGGTLAIVLALVRHPTNLTNAGDAFARQAQLAVWVHAIVIIATGLQFLGLAGLNRRLGATPDLRTAALVAFGFSWLSVTVAAAVSGFAGTSLAERYLGADETMRHTVHELFHYNSMVNQAFAKMAFVATAAAILLWSVALIRTRTLGRLVGWFGVVVGLGTLVGLMIGPVVLGVHAVLLYAVGQGAWTVWAGLKLIREPAE